MVVGVENVTAEIMNEPRYACHDALAVLATDQENDRVFLPCRHGGVPRCSRYNQRAGSSKVLHSVSSCRHNVSDEIESRGVGDLHSTEVTGCRI